ncbi:ROK family transcriptional regulator [Priestia megaterium]|uniref:ROK family transcriptional regulator n=1 Tax=Bacillaceae TaxID=186817 RepID=UPI00077C11A8|nr:MULTISPECIES: ROK family transcriptional regulator [Bacillaceae]MEC1903555.1 ROK family transcriptional regulator [Bacillus atrophaeus]MEC2399441.1 ROK family transcriptional regulator [Bacillus atrophaeus]MED4435941.1 ROK family transcriptional regulator [Bacillus atrophaeus]MED4567347.1 ROK family transcriptional regulator [Bacillus atrophaeus]MED4589871.1 ROK family transcriptional regulator [Priestia flexa]
MTSTNIAGSFKLMKSLNRTLILNIIRKDGPISRAEIAKIAKLTPPTVTNIVHELLEAQLVKESEMGVSTGGRKPILLTINAESFYVIGLDVGIHKIRAVAADLNAVIKNEQVVTIQKGIGKEELIQLLIKQVNEMMQNTNLSKDKIIGIGVGMHGVVDSKEGVALYAPNFGLKNIPIKDRLEEVFQLPVKVENDAKVLALGEKWFGYGINIQNMVCLNVGIGIGAGIIIDDKLFNGKNGIAGEIGHTAIDLNGPKCSCGNYGCLQALSSGDAIREHMLKEINLGRKTKVVELVQGELEMIEGKIIHEAAILGDELAREVLTKSGRYLGVGIANLINVMNPDLVVISGGVSKAGHYILDPIKEVVADRVLNEEAKKTNVLQSKLGDHGTAIGAITLVLADLFIPEFLNE